jgi:hypothetical protein
MTAKDKIKITFDLPAGLVKDFKSRVKKSGYTQRFLVTQVLEVVVEELKREEKQKNENR